MQGRRVGAGDFNLEVVIRRVPNGEILRKGSISQRFPRTANRRRASLILKPLPTMAGEIYFITLFAPEATPNLETHGAVLDSQRSG